MAGTDFFAVIGFLACTDRSVDDGFPDGIASLIGPVCSGGIASFCGTRIVVVARDAFDAAILSATAVFFAETAYAVVTIFGLMTFAIPMGLSSNILL